LRGIKSILPACETAIAIYDGQAIFTWRRRAVQELGALEDVLVALRWEHQIVVGEVVPHEAVLVAPGERATQKG